MVDSNYGNLSFNGPSNHLSGEEWSVVDRFDSSFWSGREVSYYFDNVRLDEVVQVSFQMLERTTPFYNYASYVPNIIVHGQRIISGEISVNFKRDGYIFSLINMLKTGDPNGLWDEFGPKSPTPTPRNDWSIGANPSNSALSLKSGSLSSSQIKKMVQEQYQKEINSSDGGSFGTDINSSGGMFSTRKLGFDINIIFGADLKDELALRYDGNSGAYADIVRVPSQQISDNIATGLKIVGASISGKGRTITDDGRAVMETFTFMARNIQVINPEEFGS